MDRQPTESEDVPRRARLPSAISWVIFSHGILTALFAALSISWLLGGMFASSQRADPLTTALVIVGFLPVVLVAAQRRGELARGSATSRLTALYGIASGLALAAATIFFKCIAHDLALIVGHQGRFPCEELDASQGPRYLLDGATLPWILFVPPPLVAGLLILVERRRRR